MPKLPTHQCDECIHFSTELLEGASETDQICERNHRPRFFKPRDPLDKEWGYKRKCADFEAFETRT